MTMKSSQPLRCLLIALLLCSLALLGAGAAGAATCAPGGCPAVFHYINFESVAPGTSVEGAGAVDPDLTITSLAWPFGPSCPAGSAMAVEEGNAFPYDAWSTNTSVENGCLNGTRGFADNEQCVLDYDFTFAPGVTVGCFGLRIVDYGDYFPFGGTSHDVTLTGYDALNHVVDTALLHMSGDVDLAAGDACTSQAGAGNTILSVAGPGIVRVSLRYDAFPDPNVGYDDITFCELTSPVPVRARSWGTLKYGYR